MDTEMDELKPTLEFRIQALEQLTQDQGSLISRLLSENSELRGKVLSMGIHLTSLDNNVKLLGDLGEVVEDHIDRLSTLSEQLKNYDERVTRLGAQIGEISRSAPLSEFADVARTADQARERTNELLTAVAKLNLDVGAFDHDVRGNGRVQLCIDGINELRKQLETLQGNTDENWNSEVNDFGKMEHEVEGLFEEVRSVADRLNAYILEVRERLNGLEARKPQPIIIKVKGGRNGRK